MMTDLKGETISYSPTKDRPKGSANLRSWREKAGAARVGRAWLNYERAKQQDRGN